MVEGGTEGQISSSFKGLEKTCFHFRLQTQHTCLERESFPCQVSGSPSLPGVAGLFPKLRLQIYSLSFQAVKL